VETLARHSGTAVAAGETRPAGQGGGGPASRPEGYAPLFRDGYRFAFFQAAHLLERALPDAPEPGTSHRFDQERIRFRADAAAVFPATDVKTVEWVEGANGGEARVTARFMGLYGTDSPLPAYFFENITREAPAAAPLQAFLDLFDHRLYSFFYRAWKKYRPGLARRGSPDPHRTRFLALAGLATPQAVEGAPVDPLRLAAFAGHLAGRPRTAEGLRIVLADLLGLPVEVLENVPRRVRLPERPRLGGARLGDGAVVGVTVRDVAGKFRLRLGPMGLAEYLTFLPGAEGAARLDRLVRFYLTDWLAYDAELLVRADELPPARLGTTPLGPTALLGRSRGVIHAHVVAYA
jgi:type VI secretion system protein ImpH